VAEHGIAAVGAGLLYAFVFDRTIDEKRLAAVAD